VLIDRKGEVGMKGCTEELENSRRERYEEKHEKDNSKIEIK
jgi:hypothetical protein